MAKLIYAAISSVDGYVADAEGNFDWRAPRTKRCIASCNGVVHLHYRFKP
jgi:hypothetical protein